MLLPKTNKITFGIINFEAFLLAALLLNLTPGADTMYILGRSISQSKKADPAYAQNAIPFLILGLTFLFTGTVWCLLLALFASKLSDKIRANYGIKVWLDRIKGNVFILLGIQLALSKK